MKNFMKNILILIIIFIAGAIIYKINTPYYILNVFVAFTSFVVGTILVGCICAMDEKQKR